MQSSCSMKAHINILFIIFPLLITSLFIIGFKNRLGDEILQPIDSKIFISNLEVEKDLHYVWLDFNYGKNNLPETTDYYPRVVISQFLNIGLSAQSAQLLYFWFFLLGIYYSAFFSIRFFLRICTNNENSKHLYASLLASTFYTFNIQMILLWAGGPGYSLAVLLISAPIFLYLLSRIICKQTITISETIILGILLGINYNTVPFNVALIIPFFMSFLLLSVKNLKQFIPNIILIIIVSLFVGAIFLTPLAIIYSNAETESLINAASAKIFSNHGIIGFYQLYFNWTIGLIFDNIISFPDSPYFSSMYSIISMFSIILISFYYSFRTIRATSNSGKVLLMLLGIILFSIFFAKGIKAPAGFVNEYFYRNVPFSNILRTPDTKFGLSTVTALSFFIA